MSITCIACTHVIFPVTFPAKLKGINTCNMYVYYISQQVTTGQGHVLKLKLFLAH